jgi:hypothetical protein
MIQYQTSPVLLSPLILSEKSLKIGKLGLGMVVHTYNLTYCQDCGSRPVPDKSGGDLVSTNKLELHWWLTPAIPATQEAEIRRIVA